MMALAVNDADAVPVASVATVMVTVPLLEVPDAPEPGAVKATFAPSTPMLAAFFTRTARGEVKAVLTEVLWLLPPVMVTEAGASLSVMRMVCW